MILQIHEEIRTTLGLHSVVRRFPPQHQSHPAFPWSCMHTDFRDCSDKPIAILSERYESE